MGLGGKSEGSGSGVRIQRGAATKTKDLKLGMRARVCGLRMKVAGQG